MCCDAKDESGEREVASDAFVHAGPDNSSVIAMGASPIADLPSSRSRTACGLPLILLSTTLEYACAIAPRTYPRFLLISSSFRSLPHRPQRMTMKPNTEVQASESSGSAILAQHPPNVFAGSHLLASSIPLPPHPLICCSVFTPTHSPAAPESLTLLENARKQVVLHNREALLVESLLPRLLISKDCVALYIFAVGSEQQMSAAQRSLAEWSFSGLECEWSSPNFTLSPVFILYIHDQAPNVTTSPRVESTLALSLAPCC